jgi:hypothetical protein
MSNNQPTLIAYSVKERGEGKKAIWSKIGAAFPHDNGKGLTIQLDALPLGDRIVLAEPKREEAQYNLPSSEAILFVRHRIRPHPGGNSSIYFRRSPGPLFSKT